MGKKAKRDDADRVSQGGGCVDPPALARVAYRDRFEPGDRADSLGVRLVRHRSALERLAESLQEVDDGQEG